MTNAAAADEALLDLGDIEPPSSTTEADDFILDLQEEAPAPSKSIWSEAAEPAVEAAVAGTNDFAQAPASTSAHGFAEEMQPAATPEPFEASSGYGVEAAHEAYVSAPGFTESSGIEIPPPEAYDTHETFAPEEVFEQEAASHSFSETASVQETAPSKEAGVETQPEGAITLEQLSPEAIDAIARRAVELLSSKVVEEIAWEVVPQLAELLIKRKLEEEKA
jgi:hypothetical protein